MPGPNQALPDRADVAVVGAGTAGAAAAALCARAGMRVVCLERGSLDGAGARWANGVVAKDFDEAGFDRPKGDELLAPGGRFHLVAGHGPERITVPEHGLIEVDMRHLVARLQQRARDASAELVDDVTVQALVDGKLVTSAGSITVDTVVDAAGLSGPNLLRSPPVPARHLCVAAQHVRRVVDMDKARDFFASHKVPMGEVVCFTGIAGGFSIVNVRCHGDHVGILTGSIAGDRYPSGTQLLDSFCAEQPWIGDRVFGGARAIPIRRPFDRIADGRIAAIGDAACQVFPAHGSGIGVGMVAARFLADTLSRGGTPHDYAVAWQRAKGGLLASYDLLRRTSELLSRDELAAMMISGLMSPELARAGMEQRLPSLGPVQAGRLAVASARHPRLAAKVAKSVPRVLATRAHYRRYPPSPADLRTWSRRIARIFGEVPDLG